MKNFKLPLQKAITYLTLLVIVVLLGFYGFSKYYEDLNTTRSLTGLLYDVVRLFFLEHSFPESEVPLALNIARFMAPLLLATALINVFYSYLKKFIDVQIIRVFYRNHIVFCGFGLKSKMIADFYKDDNKRLVIIEINPDGAYVSDFRYKRLRKLFGDAATATNLLKAGIVKASRVYISSGNDSKNLQIIKNIQDIFDDPQTKINKKRKHPIQITVEMVEHASQRFFKQLQDKKGDLIEINSINAYQKFAAYLIDKYSPDKYISLCEPHDKPAHILINGFNKLSENIILEAAHIYHFPHFKKTRITVCADDVENARKKFFINFPDINRVIDTDFVEEEAFFEHKFRNIADEVSVCFICGADDAENFLKAKRLRQEFFDYFFRRYENPVLDGKSKTRFLNTPPIVLASSATAIIYGLFGNFSKIATTLNIQIERLHLRVCSKNLMVNDHELNDDIARQIHNKYLGLDSKELDTAWEQLTDEGKDQNRWAARHFSIKLRYLGITLVDKAYGLPLQPSGDLPLLKVANNYEKLKVIAQMEHNRWNAEKLLTGFIPGKPMDDKDYYLVLKENLKWHKDIRPWEELSDTDKKKDKMMNDIASIIANLTYKQVTAWNISE